MQESSSTTNSSSLQASIVMPLYNEAGTLPQIVSIVLSQPCVSQLVIVDDASTDGSHEIAERLTDRFFRWLVRAFD